MSVLKCIAILRKLTHQSLLMLPFCIKLSRCFAKKCLALNTILAPAMLLSVLIITLVTWTNLMTVSMTWRQSNLSILSMRLLVRAWIVILLMLLPLVLNFISMNLRMVLTTLIIRLIIKKPFVSISTWRLMPRNNIPNIQSCLKLLHFTI